MLTISNLTVEIEGKKIINNLSLEIAPGQCHAIMGPNGAGKSSLAKVLAGDPSYEVVEGNITFNGEDLLEMEVEDRAKNGREKRDGANRRRICFIYRKKSKRDGHGRLLFAA